MTLSLVKFQSFHLVDKIWKSYIIHSDLKVWFIHINTLYHKMSLVYANQIKKKALLHKIYHIYWFGNVIPPKIFSHIMLSSLFSSC